MSQRYLGGVITANPTTPTMTSESGVWTLEQQFQYSSVWSPEIIGNSLRFRSSASAYLNRTPASASNRKTWTFSAWIKRGDLSGAYNKYVFSAKPSASVRDGIYFGTAQTLSVFANDGASALLTTTQVFRDPSAWYHIVVAVDTTQATSSNRIKVYVNGVQVTAFGTATYPSLDYQWAVDNSVVHTIGDDAANAPTGLYNYDGYMAEIYFVDGQALTPSSFGAFDSTGVWQPLPYTGTYGTNGFYLDFSNNVDTLLLGLNPAVASNYFQYSEQLDNAYWSKFNVTIAANTTDTTDPLGTNTADKLTMSAAGNSYVYRNSGITATTQWVLSGYFKAGTVSSIELYISSSGGADGGIGVFTLTGSGSASFSPLNGSSGTASIQFVGNGWYRCVLACRGSSGQNAGTIDAGSTGTAYGWGMQLEIGSTVGTYTQTVASSIINNWTPNNFSLTTGATYDWMLDSPTNSDNGGTGRGNYAVLNAVYVDAANATSVISNGNLLATGTGSSTQAFGTIGVSSGKWYWEQTVTALPASGVMFVGPVSSPYTTTNLRAYRHDNGQYFNGSAWVSYGAAYTTNDVIGVALDLDSQTITFYKNGVSQGTNSSIGLSGITVFPYLFINISPGAIASNFGQRPFAYTPPTGYLALNTQNLSTPTILNGAQVMAATTYTGTGATQTISNGGNNTIATTFKPDLVWIKGRSTAVNHRLADSSRQFSAGAYYLLSSNLTAAEVATTDFSSFNSNGFTISDAAYDIDDNGTTYVAWQWQAGQGTTSSNTSGSITSTVSVNATAGFSVVTYTGNGSNGATAGHGLGVAPSMVIVKNRDATYSWMVKTSSLASTYNLRLQDTGAATAAFGSGYVDGLTSTVFTLYSGASDIRNVNGNTEHYVAYCWAAVAGYSAFGTYTGNGSTDGPFVYLGFRPRWIMLKITSAADSWYMFDTSRDSINVMSAFLAANSSSAEGSVAALDVTANGFKLRSTNTAFNASGATFIYAAFAENPFKIARAR